MPSQEILYTNIFGEPFFEEDGTVFKVSPETGDIEPVCTFADFDTARLGGSARPAGSEPLPGSGNPFCFGRRFRDPESDVSPPARSAHILRGDPSWHSASR